MMNKAFFLFTILCIILTSCIEQKSVKKDLESENRLSIADKFTIDSKVLGEEREILVYVPEGFYGMGELSKVYPATYVMDAEGQFLSTVGLLEQMSSPFSANDVLPQMIVVGVVNINRNKDLTPTAAIIGKDSSSIAITGGAGKMAEFFEKELIPFIERKYPVAPHRTLIGHSLGGLFVLNTLIYYPHLFQNYLCIDPFMSWDDYQFSKTVVDSLRSQEHLKRKLFIATANLKMPWLHLDDVRSDTTEVMAILRSNLDFKDEMEAHEIKISYLNPFYENENHFQVPIPGIYDGMKFFFDFYPFPSMMEYYYPREHEGKLLEELTEHYSEISKQMGYEVLPMKSYINSWAFGFTQFNRNDLAEELFDMNIEHYPESFAVYRSKGYFNLSKEDTLGAIEYFKASIKKKEDANLKSLIKDLSSN